VNPSVLIVDDEKAMGTLLVRSLQRAGFDAKAETNPEVALEHLKERPFDVLITDLRMPKIDGLEVLRRLRADSRTATVRVVIFTTSREERDIVSSYNLGANSFVRKPLDFHDFAEAVRQLGMYWLLLNEPYPP
jgi:DNA-binding response OmpR family regulator